MYDYHTHTNFSDDSQAPMETMITAAIKKGIKELAITDHYDPGYPDPEFPFIIDFNDYQRALLEYSEKYKDKLRIVKGLELGIMEGQYENSRKQLSAFPYDFVIGSFHCLHGYDLYTFDFSKVDRPTKLEEFYLYINKCLKEYKNYDIAGHFSIIDRYIGEIYDYSPYMDIIEDTLKTIIYDGKGLEINTSSFKYKMGISLPRTEILKSYQRLGGEILTIGSDAHDPSHLLDHFKDAKELASSLGFKYHCTFKDRKASFVKF